MKTIKAIMLAGALAMTATASAQFANTSNSNAASANAAGSIKDTNPYDRLSVSFMSETISPDKGDNTSLSGVSIDYIHGFSLSKTLPIFLETGVDFSAGFKSNDVEEKNLLYGDSESVKTTLMSLAIPVNVAYKFNVNPDFSIQPFLGLNFKFNIVGKQKYKVEFKDSDEQEAFDTYIEDSDIKLDTNMFDKKDLNDNKDAVWKRFQMGWHIGAGINYKQLWIGLSYGTDFISLCKKTNTSTFKVGVGINF